MQTDRYDYSPIIKRKPLKWPNGARVALMVAPNIEFFHVDKVIPGAPSSQLPDVTGYALRDYGSRIGVFRMMDVLDKHGIRATVLLNADVCSHHPAIIEEGNKRNWEWLGHGVTNNIRINQYPPEEERAVIRQIKETIAAATGKYLFAATATDSLSVSKFLDYSIEIFPSDGSLFQTTGNSAVLLAGFLLWICYGSAAGIPALVIPNIVALLVGATVIIVALRLRRRAPSRGGDGP